MLKSGVNLEAEGLTAPSSCDFPLHSSTNPPVNWGGAEVNNKQCTIYNLSLMLCVVTFSPHPKTAKTIERSASAYWKQSWKEWTAVEPYCYSRPLSDRVPSLQTQCLLVCPRLTLTLTNLLGLLNLADADLRCKLWLCRLLGRYFHV